MRNRYLGLALVAVLGPRAWAAPLRDVEMRRAWTARAFTDPAAPKASYRYLVHSFLPATPYGRRLLRDPSSMGREGTALLSTSVTDPANATYHPAGFILRVPASNIVSTADRDVNVDNASATPIAEAQRVNERWGIIGPRALVERASRLGLYNEVVVERRSKNGTVAPIGAFVSISPETNRPALAPSDERALRRAAKKAHLPVVELDRAPEVDNFIAGPNHGAVPVFRSLAHDSTRGGPIRFLFSVPQEESTPDWSQLVGIRWRNAGVSHELSLAPGAPPRFLAVRGKEGALADTDHRRERQMRAELADALGARHPAMQALAR